MTTAPASSICIGDVISWGTNPSKWTITEVARNPLANHIVEARSAEGPLLRFYHDEVVTIERR